LHEVATENERELTFCHKRSEKKKRCGRDVAEIRAVCICWREDVAESGDGTPFKVRRGYGGGIRAERG